MNSEEKMREEFEVWAKSVGLVITAAQPGQNYNEYWIDETDTAWLAWKASRESLVIELPGGRYDLCAMTNEIRGWNRAYDACVESIHAAGVKTK